MKIGFHLREAELKRVRRAARRRQMTVTEFVKEATQVWSSEDVSTRPAELDPFARRPATMHRLRIGFHLREAELKRVRRAARRRQMTVTEFVKEATLVWSSEDVSTRPAELNPFGRKAATMHRLAKR